MNTATYQIKLDQFEGPFDLLLFFIERDELDIYNIPITKITNDFLDFIHHTEKLNIELSSEFILFISTLMRIKAKMLIPRKEIDEQGNEIDPRQELINKILEYKRFKEASVKMLVVCWKEAAESHEPVVRADWIRPKRFFLPLAILPSFSLAFSLAALKTAPVTTWP